MKEVFTHWQLESSTLAFLIFITVAYLYLVKFHPDRKSFWFISGIACIVFCTFSPLHVIGAHYLFSLHMLCHVVLLLIAAPLLVMGVPSDNRYRQLLEKWAKAGKRYPLLFWFCGVAVMWVWHIPAVFNKLFSMPHYMGQSSFLMELHSLSMILAGVLFCWPVINPYPRYRLSSLKSILYLSTACLFCSLLGLLITFAPLGIYAPYLHIHDHYGYLPIIRTQWGINAAVDQEMAGLIMWVPCCFIYLSVSMGILLQWLAQKEEVKIQTVKPNLHGQHSQYS